MKIPLSQPDITKKEHGMVLGVLKTPFLAQGPKLKEFEKKIARYIGTKYAVAVSSGTAGLHLLVRAMNIGKDDEVITTPFSFIASANCILYEKAKPIFVDIDPLTLNIDPGKIERAITKKTKGLLIVDIFGHPADWNPILKIAKKYRLKVIEDSCEALGAMYKSEILNSKSETNSKFKIQNLKSEWIKCGNFGQAAVFAFYPNKQITTGEGAMIVTDNKRIADLCQSMANQGRKIKNGAWLEHVRLGYNYRMTEMQAALGISQLSRIKEILKKREKVAQIYNQYLSKIPEIKIPHQAPQTPHQSKLGTGQAKISWFVYVIRLSKKYTRQDRDKILKKLQAAGIQCSNYFQCIHLQSFYRKQFSYKRGDFPIAESISDRTIALPFYNNLTEQKIGYISKILKQCLS